MPRLTVVGTARCMPGREADVARAAAEHLGRPGPRIPGRIDAHLFEDDNAPCTFVYVGRWETRAAFEDSFRGLGQFGEPGWYAAPPTVQFYEPLKTYVEMYAPSRAASLALADVPTEAAPAARAHLLAYGRQVSAHDLGAVEYEFGEATDRPGRFLALAKWRTPADRDAYRTGAGAHFLGELATLGASIQQFGGLQRAKTPWEPPH